MKIFLESQKETSKLSRNVFWGRWDHLAAQKSNFKIFSSKMTLTHAPPLLTYLRDIYPTNQTLVSYDTRVYFSVFEPGHVRVRDIFVDSTQQTLGL